MRRNLLIFMLFSVKAFAQYPFEKFQQIKYHQVEITNYSSTRDSSYIGTATYKGYEIQLLEKRLKDGSNILIYYHHSLICKFKDDDIEPTRISHPISVADIDGNGLMDFKISFSSDGSGLAGSLIRKIYLFHNHGGRFSKISFEDFSNSNEYDFNGDGNYEIIAKAYQIFKQHAYWVFNLYDFRNGKLINVDAQFNYPIMVQNLDRKNYQITKKVSRREMKQFSMKFPVGTLQQN